MKFIRAKVMLTRAGAIERKFDCADRARYRWLITDQKISSGALFRRWEVQLWVRNKLNTWIIKSRFKCAHFSRSHMREAHGSCSNAFSMMNMKVFVRSMSISDQNMYRSCSLIKVFSHVLVRKSRYSCFDSKLIYISKWPLEVLLSGNPT